MSEITFIMPRCPACDCYKVSLTDGEILVSAAEDSREKIQQLESRIERLREALKRLANNILRDPYAEMVKRVLANDDKLKDTDV